MVRTLKDTIKSRQIAILIADGMVLGIFRFYRTPPPNTLQGLKDQYEEKRIHAYGRPGVHAHGIFKIRLRHILFDL